MAKLQHFPSRLTSMAPKLKAATKTAELFYQSPEWRALAARRKREAGSCEQRITVGAVTVRCGSRDRLIADHIVERKDGGAPLDPSNVQVLCFAHHQQKTARARAERARGQPRQP